MYTNADVTLYLYSKCGKQESYRRLFVEDVLLVIPLESLFEPIRFTSGKDLAVKGQCNMELNCTDQKALAESLQKLKNCYDSLTVMMVDEKLFGSEMMQHYELSCR